MKETVKEFVDRVVKEAKVDIDIEYCKKNNIKFPSRPEAEVNEEEVWARLADTEHTKKIFDFLLK